MYYLIKGILHDSEDPEIVEGTFEWALKSEQEKEDALGRLSEYEEVTEILEISLEECIAHEEKILHSYVRKDYQLRRCMDMEEEEYFDTQKKLNEQSELYLTALQEYNLREILMKRLLRRKNLKKITMDYYLKILNELLDAQTDEERSEILRKIDKK